MKHVQTGRVVVGKGGVEKPVVQVYPVSVEMLRPVANRSKTPDPQGADKRPDPRRQKRRGRIKLWAEVIGIVTGVVFVIGALLRYLDNASAIVTFFRSGSLPPTVVPIAPVKVRPRITALGFDSTGFGAGEASFGVPPTSVAVLSGLNFSALGTEPYALKVSLAKTAYADGPEDFRLDVPINATGFRTSPRMGTKDWECILNSESIIDSSRLKAQPYGRYVIDWKIVDDDGIECERRRQAFSYVLQPSPRASPSEAGPKVWNCAPTQSQRILTDGTALILRNDAENTVTSVSLMAPFDFPTGWAVQGIIRATPTGARTIGMELGFHPKSPTAEVFSVVIGDGAPNRFTLKQGKRLSVEPALTSPGAMSRDEPVRFRLSVQKRRDAVVAELALGGVDGPCETVRSWPLTGAKAAPSVNRIDLRMYNIGTLQLREFWVEQLSCEPVASASAAK
jgi:hypothetical protein